MYTPASQILGGDFELTFELMRKDYEIFSRFYQYPDSFFNEMQAFLELKNNSPWNSLLLNCINHKYYMRIKLNLNWLLFRFHFTQYIHTTQSC